MLVEETTVGEVQVTPPTVVVAPVRNPVPVIVIDVLPAVVPVSGETEVTVGAGVGVNVPDVMTRSPFPSADTATKRSFA
jgi:hypothetical protein